jgi:hypothetical protein
MSFLDENFTPITAQRIPVPTASPVIAPFIFYPADGYSFTLENIPVNSVVEMREENEVSWASLNVGDYDMSAYAGAKTRFFIRVTPDDPRVVSEEIVKLTVIPNA